MKLAINIGYSGARMALPLELVLEAEAETPDELCDELSLCGPEACIRARYGAWEDAGVTTLMVQSRQRQAHHLMAEVAGTLTPV